MFAYVRRSREYDAFVPCAKQLADALAEDYANAKGWCDFNKDAAAILPLQTVSAAAVSAFQKTKRKYSVRLAFLFIVHHDETHVSRLFRRLYSTEHYYLIHIDKIDVSPQFEKAMRALALECTNVFVVKEMLIMQGTASASVLLARTMAWYLKHALNWDYLVSVTGADYPLIPLKKMEKMLFSQEPPRPFLMAWSFELGNYVRTLMKTHTKYKHDELLRNSITITKEERETYRGGFGSNTMPTRSLNFGAMLSCQNMKNYYHLDNRHNWTAKDPTHFDTQWLFPKGFESVIGEATRSRNTSLSAPAVDNVHRIWMKSDPSTTGLYDFETVNYIVNSSEGRKYYHFFKYMLFGYEEHYFVTLLYNWKRTANFVSTLRAQGVWNTWSHGIMSGVISKKSAAYRTRTSYLSDDLWDILLGLSKRGVFFARKFATNISRELLDRIDAEILFSNSFKPGSAWPPAELDII